MLSETNGVNYFPTHGALAPKETKKRGVRCSPPIQTAGTSWGSSPQVEPDMSHGKGSFGEAALLRNIVWVVFKIREPHGFMLVFHLPSKKGSTLSQAHLLHA